MKKLLSVVIMLSLFLLLLPKANAEAPVDLSSASAALLIDADSGTVIAEKDPDVKLEAAGLKRLPALLMICDAFDSGSISEDTIVTVSPEAARMRGATAFLSSGERIEAGHLLKAAVMINAGDAAYALVNAIWPSGGAALEAVNSRLSELGCGRLDDALGEGRSFSANEIASVALELLKSEAFLKYSSVYLDAIPHENASATELTNPNRLVRFYSGCFGLATGSVGSSEYSGAFAARRGNTTFLAVVLGAPDSSTRFKLAEELLDHGFASFRSVEIGKAGDVFGEVSVIGGSANSVEAVLGCDLFMLTGLNGSKLLTEAELPDSIEAPIAEGSEIGTLNVRSASGDLLISAPLTAKSTIERACFKDIFIRLVMSWLRADRS